MGQCSLLPSGGRFRTFVQRLTLSWLTDAGPNVFVPFKLAVSILYKNTPKK